MNRCTWLKAVLSTLIAGMILLSGSGGSTALASEANAAVEAAERALDTYKGFVPWDQFGFASEQELRQARVGEGIPIYRLDFSTAAKDLETLGDAIRDVKMLEFVVSSDGRPITRLTLRQLETGEYRRYEFGGQGEYLQRGLSALPSQAGVKLVRLGAMEFLYLNHQGTEYVVPIGPIPLSGVELLKLYTFKEVQPAIQKFALKTLEADPDASGGPGGASAGEGSFPASWWMLAAIGALPVGIVARKVWWLAHR